MTAKSKLWLGIFVVIGLALAAGFFASIDRRPDDVLIKQALADSIEASREGRPGGVMDFISDQITINTMGGISKAKIAQLIRDNKPSVTVSNQEVKVDSDGETAEMTSDVDVAGEIGMLQAKQAFNYKFEDVKMTFQKENGRKFLVIPTKVWRLRSVEIPDDQQIINLGF
jgi:hypothetical protein